MATADKLVKYISKIAGKTYKKSTNKKSFKNIGSFGSIYDLSPLKVRNPLIVSSTDGVGTKVEIAREIKKYNTIGIDLVAMCVNDLIVQGAKPIFFLDYIALNKLELKKVKKILDGIVEGCMKAGCALVGGETAEMPGTYNKNKFDLAGFAVGIVDKKKLLIKNKVKKNNIILAVPSSGIHSNGFSLIRYILKKRKISYLPKKIKKDLIEPTKIYVKEINALSDRGLINACANITGGGLTNNIPRVLPKGLCARIQIDSWPLPKMFRWLAESGPVEEAEMLRTFNCGIGMVLIVPPECAKNISLALTDLGEKVHFIGEVARQKGSVVFSGRLLD